VAFEGSEDDRVKFTASELVPHLDSRTLAGSLFPSLSASGMENRLLDSSSRHFTPWVCSFERRRLGPKQ